MEDTREHGRAVADEELRLDQRLDDRPSSMNITDAGRVVQMPNVMDRLADSHLDACVLRLRMNVQEGSARAERPMQSA
jgi:hypothetical protein